MYADAIPEIVETCTLECGEGRLRAVVRVGNGGMTDMPDGVPVQLYGDYGGTQVLLDERGTSEVVALKAKNEDRINKQLRDMQDNDEHMKGNQ